MSPEQLARFFSKEDNSYRISAELRSNVVFTVHDVLADPPFSRLDFVSCRNLLIYLLPEAQAKVISILHFALREGGLLLVGDAETVGVADGRFVAVAKPQRLYRRVGGARPGDFALSPNPAGGSRLRERRGPTSAPSRQSELAELCRRMVLDAYGPAAVLINRKLECLYFQGAVDRYLKIGAGRPVNDLISMAREGVRTKLRSAVERALSENARVVMPGARTKGAEGAAFLSIIVTPAPRDHEDLLQVCFVEEPAPQAGRSGGVTPADVPRLVELEKELEATKTELQGALRNLEISSEEQMAINEEALSVNEEYQSTNEELLASKEELQSLNEELTALNSQLQETLERQRTTGDDLQNVLYSTKVATIFLDTRFNIRSSRRRRKRFSMSFRATSGARSPTSSRSRPTRRSWKTPNPSSKLRRRSSGRSKARAAPGLSVGSCRTALATRTSRASSSPMKTSPNGGERRRRSATPSVKPNWRASPRRASSLRQATTCGSHCKP